MRAQPEMQDFRQDDKPWGCSGPNTTGDERQWASKVPYCLLKSHRPHPHWKCNGQKWSQVPFWCFQCERGLVDKGFANVHFCCGVSSECVDVLGQIKAVHAEEYGRQTARQWAPAAKHNTKSPADHWSNTESHIASLRCVNCLAAFGFCSVLSRSTRWPWTVFLSCKTET